MTKTKRFGAVGAISTDASSDPLAHGEAHHRGWVVTSRWRRRSGRLVPVGVEITTVNDERIVTAEAVRRLPIGEMLAETRAAINHTAAMASNMPDVGDVVDSYRAQGPKRGQALTTEDLEVVAAAYREAWADGRSVNRAVQKACDLTESGAAKRIMRAREAGLLDDVGPQS